MWSEAGQLDWWVKTGDDGSVAYAVQTAVNGGSELLIFVPRAGRNRDFLRNAASGARLIQAECLDSKTAVDVAFHEFVVSPGPSGVAAPGGPLNSLESLQ